MFPLTASTTPKGIFTLPVVHKPFQMPEQHIGELVERLQPLPSQLAGPGAEIPQLGSFIGVSPEPVETFLQKVSLHHAPVQSKQVH